MINILFWHMNGSSQVLKKLSVTKGGGILMQLEGVPYENLISVFRLLLIYNVPSKMHFVPRLNFTTILDLYLFVFDFCFIIFDTTFNLHVYCFQFEYFHCVGIRYLLNVRFNIIFIVETLKTKRFHLFTDQFKFMF